MSDERCGACCSSSHLPAALRGSSGALSRSLQGVACSAAEGGQEYTTRLATQLGFLNFRLPFNTFRYTSGGGGARTPGPRQAHQPRHQVRAEHDRPSTRLSMMQRMSQCSATARKGCKRPGQLHVTQLLLMEGSH